MAETVPTISKLIEEHQQIRENLNVCQEAVNDLVISEKVKAADGILSPGRIEDHRKTAVKLEKELMAIENNLRNHFGCEEQSLLEDFRQTKVDRLVNILGELIREHEGILKNISDLRRDILDLTNSQASVASWHEKAWRIRPLMLQLNNRIKEHSEQEDKLYQEAKILIESKPK
jgi:hypothetical protein